MTSELHITDLVRLEATRAGAMLWRNNVGATYTREGRFLRYGLANESQRLNTVLKSSDLIGIKPVLITQDMVGKTLGVFLAREIKTSTWKYSGSDREKAQLAFINLINKMGGDAAFANSEGTICTHK